jgi:flagellar protein FlgJ
LDDHLAVLKKPGYADAWPHRNDPVEYARLIVDKVGDKYATGTQYAAAMANFIREVKSFINK